MNSREKQGLAFVPDGDRRGSDVPPAPSNLHYLPSARLDRTPRPSPPPRPASGFPALLLLLSMLAFSAAVYAAIAAAIFRVLT